MISQLARPTSHYFKLLFNVVDTIISDALQAMFSTGLSERFADDKALSADDRHFLQIMKDGVEKLSGRYVAPAPFQGATFLMLNN